MHGTGLAGGKTKRSPTQTCGEHDDERGRRRRGVTQRRRVLDEPRSVLRGPRPHESIAGASRRERGETGRSTSHGRSARAKSRDPRSSGRDHAQDLPCGPTVGLGRGSGDSGGSDSHPLQGRRRKQSIAIPASFFRRSPGPDVLQSHQRHQHPRRARDGACHGACHGTHGTRLRWVFKGAFKKKVLYRGP